MKQKNRWSKRKQPPAHPSVSVTPATYAKVKLLAKRNKTTLSAVIAAMVERSVAKESRKRR